MEKYCTIEGHSFCLVFPLNRLPSKTNLFQRGVMFEEECAICVLYVGH